MERNLPILIISISRDSALDDDKESVYLFGHEEEEKRF